MGLMERVTQPARRTGILGFTVVLGVVGAIILWQYEQPWAALVLCVLTALMVGVLKGLFEAVTQLRNLARQQESTVTRVERLDGATAQLNSGFDGVALRLEKVGTRQESFNEAVLDRVRGLESVGRRQEGHNEAVLDRVRDLESVGRRQERFNEAVLNRVRNLERKPGEALAPPGSERRVGLAERMVSEALVAFEQSRFYVPESERVSATSPVIAREADPLVSVIVTCYNMERFIAEGLESIRAQSYGNWECIVVDDLSTDSSSAIIERTIAGDGRFRLIRQPENRGVVVARNTGTEYAAGEFIVFHDADDLLMEHSLADRVETLRNAGDSDVAGVYCGQRIADEGVLLEELQPSEAWTPRGPFVDFVTAAGECPFGPTQSMFRIDVVRALGGFAVGTTNAEDWEFWLRMMRHGFIFLPSKLLTVAYRQTTTSMAQTGAASHVGISNRLIASAHSPAELSVDETVASYPFPEPLAHYQELLTRARRAVQYATTALVRSDIAAFDTILGTFESGSMPLLRRHVSFERKVTDGLRRAAGLDLADLGLLEDERDQVIGAVSAAIGLAAR